MSDQPTYDALQTGALILQVNAARTAPDEFILSTSLASLLTARLADCRSRNAAAEFAASDAVGAAGRVVQANERLAALDRNGNSFLGSVDSESVTPDSLSAAYTLYGFPGGALGDLKDGSRVRQIARKAVEIAATPPATLPVELRWPATLIARLTSWLAIYDANNGIANGGTRQTLIDQRNTARDLLEAAISRVRHAYCSASDAGEFTPELAKIDMQPRRKPGDAQSQPLPEAPGLATLDPAARTLTMPGLPAHATTLAAFRQVPGGPIEPAGLSSTSTVSLTANTPLEPGIEYSVWVEGKNSRGFGPKSNVIKFVA